MSKRATRGKSKKAIAALSHEGASRRNIPTAEYEPVLEEGDKSPVPVSFERRNRDLDPQLMWRGKDEQDWTDLVVHAHPLYIQEKVHPKVLVDELRRQTEQAEAGEQPGGHVEDLFADFNGLPDGAAKTEFYQHDANWSNRMILGDSLQVMASLAEREGLRGKVQCIYLDPPYGIKFNSNFQWSTTSRDVKDGTAKHITREPEQVKAFRDTWRDGIHSYLSYLRDRLMAARDLLAETGSIFVQIGDENVHRVRAVMDEVFGDDNFIAIISYVKTSGKAGRMLDNVTDYIIWYAKDKEHVKYRQGYVPKVLGMEGTTQYIWAKFDDGIERRLTAAELARPESIAHGVEVYAVDNLTAQSANNTTTFEYQFNGKVFSLGKGGWKTNLDGMKKLEEAGRLKAIGNTLMYRRLLDDFPVSPTSNVWRDVLMTGFSEPKVYVVQSSSKAIQRCILMSSDPGDLVLDPTCGSGTTAYVAEQWGRRWITIDTSRVALALARSRIMGARYPYYLLADSEAGIRKEAELAHTYPPPPRKINHGQHPPRLRLRTGAAYHTEIHRQQRRDRCDLGTASRNPRALARAPEQSPQAILAGMGNSPGG